LGEIGGDFFTDSSGHPDTFTTEASTAHKMWQKNYSFWGVSRRGAGSKICWKKVLNGNWIFLLHWKSWQWKQKKDVLSTDAWASFIINVGFKKDFSFFSAFLNILELFSLLKNLCKSNRWSGFFILYFKNLQKMFIFLKDIVAHK
jgi:hypothetical protein